MEVCQATDFGGYEGEPVTPFKRSLVRRRLFSVTKKKNRRHTQAEDGEAFHRKEFRGERRDQVTHEIELEDVSFFARILDRLRSFERPRAGSVDGGFSVDSRQRPPKKESLLGRLGGVEKPGQIANRRRYRLELSIAAQKWLNERDTSREPRYLRSIWPIPVSNGFRSASSQMGTSGSMYLDVRCDRGVAIGEPLVRSSCCKEREAATRSRPTKRVPNVPGGVHGGESFFFS